MIALSQYITLRLGRTPREQARNFLARPFGAASLAAFWQSWNPVWGYFLLYYCYRPLRRGLPQWSSAWLTFVICGVVHDLPFALAAFATGGQPPRFTLTLFFLLVGSLVVLGEAIRLRFTALPHGLRWPIHCAVLIACYQTALYLTATA